MTETPSTERRRALTAQLSTLVETLETDASEFRRLVKSFLRKPQLVYLRELLRTGPARRNMESEAAWKGLRQSLLPLLEKGEIMEGELPWFLSWAARLATTRLPRFERPAAFDRGRPGAPGRGDWGARPGPGGPGGPPPSGRANPSRFERPASGQGRPGPQAFRGPDRGGPQRGGPPRGQDRNAPRMPPQQREVDTRWEGLKGFKFEDDDNK